VLEGLSDVLAQWVVGGDVDFAVTTMPFATRRRGLVTDVLFHDRFVVAVGADHALVRAPASVAAADLLEFPWVLPPRDGTLWQRVLDLFHRHGLKAPEPQVETNSGVCIKGLLLTGRFVSVVPRQLVAHEEAKGDIVILSAKDLYIEREVFVLTREGSILSPGAEAIIGEFRRRGAADALN
ncbi:MAG: LysR substrate-binding domain-containing protein, partial [Alphaproteobacteria bacterium]